MQSKWFLGRSLGPLLKTGLFLMRNTLKSLAKSILISSRLTATTFAVDVVIRKKLLGSKMTAIIWKREISDSMKIAKSLEESGLLTKGVSEKIKNETKEQKRWTS